MTPQTIEKYRQAGIIAQNALSIVISQLHQGIGEKTIGEVCRLGDAYIRDQAQKCFKNVEEKGVARPVEICKNDFLSGIAPEEHDTFQASIVNPGDVIKVTLGVHVDGFTVMAGHTVVIREQSESQAAEPVVGLEANAIIGAFLATEAVVSLLASVISENHPLRASYPSVTGGLVRSVVEEIASTFGLLVVPGSRVRRIKRFVAGQPTVQDNLPSVEWRPYTEEDESKLIAELDNEFVATAGHTYTIDIQMAPKLESNGYIALHDVPNIGSALDGPSIYTRDQTVTYKLRTAAARQLLNGVDKQLSVYPFKLSFLADAMPINQLKLGLNECVQRHLLVGEPRLKALFTPTYRPKEAVPAIVAREVATVSLIPGQSSGSGYPELFRLSGGRSFPPSWTHSEKALAEGQAADALNARLNPHTGLRYVEVKPTQRTLGIQETGEAEPGSTQSAVDMDVEV